ncbi:keratin-associated protein 10-2-like isoform X2 [Littorina saxatilis]|uniref:Uncharacterized protein n=1 Tax=Littorina saxatilis TaxID=31220 RepID=A0AAN9AQQ6_9CAEN
MCGSRMAQLTAVVLLGLVGHVHSQCLTTLMECGTSSPCCSNLVCAFGLCLPCFPAGSPGACSASTCCAGATCTNGRCVASTANDPVSATPAPAVPANPTSCLQTLTAGCGTSSPCCSNLVCAFGLCLPCLPAGSLATCSASTCCAGATCTNGRCVASTANDPVSATPAPAVPANPTSCVALLASGCQTGAAANSPSRCCAGSTCRSSVCFPCLSSGGTCFGTSSCCDGLVCSANRCQAPVADPFSPLPPNDPLTPAPSPAPLDPANCRPLNTLGCSDSVTSLRCCAGSYCNLATACLQCIGAGNSTACVVDAQDTRRCCEGLGCVGGTCTAPQDPTQPPAVSVPGVTVANPTPATPCAQFGAPCSAASPCCPGGLTCSAQTNICTFNIVGRLS